MDIEKEVQARVDFKMNELLTAVRNTAKANWNTSFNSNSQKHAHYGEAFVKVEATTKEFEVLRITYRWDKYTRKLSNNPKLQHYKYYKTLNSALDAVRDFRNSWYDKAYYDYPALGGGIEHEQKYPHIKPTITIHRYKVVRRNDLPCV